MTSRRPATPSPLLRMLRAVREQAASTESTPESAHLSALRLAVARAGRHSLSCDLSVAVLTETKLPAAIGLIDPLSSLALVAPIQSPGGDTGLVAMDRTGLDIVLGLRTTGRLTQSARPNAGTEKPATLVEAALVRPLVNSIMTAWHVALEGDKFERLVTGYRCGAPGGSVRGQLLSVTEGGVYWLQLELLFGHDILAKMAFVLPIDRIDLPRATSRKPNSTDGQAWSHGLTSAVLDSRIPIEAVLHRQSLSLTRLQALTEGDILRLPDDALSRVILTTEDRTAVALGRLGQRSGARALRLSALGAQAFRTASGSTPGFEGTSMGFGSGLGAGIVAQGRGALGRDSPQSLAAVSMGRMDVGNAMPPAMPPPMPSQMSNAMANPLDSADTAEEDASFGPFDMDLPMEMD